MTRRLVRIRTSLRRHCSGIIAVWFALPRGDCRQIYTALIDAYISYTIKISTLRRLLPCQTTHTIVRSSRLYQSDFAQEINNRACGKLSCAYYIVKYSWTEKRHKPYSAGLFVGILITPFVVRFLTGSAILACFADAEYERQKSETSDAVTCSVIGRIDCCLISYSPMMQNDEDL